MDWVEILKTDADFIHELVDLLDRIYIQMDLNCV